MISRRNLLASAAAVPLSATTSRMFLCMHQTTSAGSTFRASLEGYARAGIRYVEITLPMIGEFVKTGNIAEAKRIIKDLGLTAVSFGGVRGLAEPSAGHVQAVEGTETHECAGGGLGNRSSGLPMRNNRKIYD